MRIQVDTTQRKNKSKQSTKKNQVKTVYKEDSWLQNANQSNNDKEEDLR
jgi:hypothetical protein